MHTPELGGVTIVGAGTFNPAIIHPSWLAEKDLISRDLASAALRERSEHQMVVSARLASFVADWLTVQVTQNKAVFSTVDQGRELDLRDFVRGLFEILPETPIDGVGINSDSHFRAPSEETWHDFGDRFLPKDFWEPLFARGNWKTRPDGKRVGLRSMTVEAQRDDDIAPGYVRVEIAPSVRVTPLGIYVGMNGHFQLTREGGRGNAAIAAGLIQEQWQATRELASELLSSITAAI